MDPIVSAGVGAALGWIVPTILKKTLGTKHITAKECERCETRQALSNIQDMLIEVAIKAGVPIHEAIRAVKGPGGRRTYDPEERSHD